MDNAFDIIIMFETALQILKFIGFCALAFVGLIALLFLGYFQATSDMTDKEKEEYAEYISKNGFLSADDDYWS